MEKRGKKNFTTPAANVVVMVATKASGVSRKREKRNINRLPENLYISFICYFNFLRSRLETI
jgi:hypothetical protein